MLVEVVFKSLNFHDQRSHAASKHVAPTALGWVSAGGMEVQPSLPGLNCAAPNPALKRRAIVICPFGTICTFVGDFTSQAFVPLSA